MAEKNNNGLSYADRKSILFSMNHPESTSPQSDSQLSTEVEPYVGSDVDIENGVTRKHLNRDSMKIDTDSKLSRELSRILTGTIETKERDANLMLPS